MVPINFNIIAHTVHLMSASGMSIDYKRLLKIYLNSCLVMLETLTSEVVTLLRGNMESDIVIWLLLAFLVPVLQKVKLRPLTVCQENTIVKRDVTYSVVRNVHQVHILKNIFQWRNQFYLRSRFFFTANWPFSFQRFTKIRKSFPVCTIMRWDISDVFFYVKGTTLENQVLNTHTDKRPQPCTPGLYFTTWQ